MTLFEDRIKHDLITYEPLEQIDLNIEKYLNLLNDFCSINNKEDIIFPFEMKFTVLINSGLYKFYKLNFSLLINQEYPFEGPKLKCFSKIFHPNIWDSHVCMSILRDTWTPVNNLSIIMYSLYVLLDINEDSLLNNKKYKDMFIENALNTEVSEWILKDKNGFVNYVKSKGREINRSSKTIR